MASKKGTPLKGRSPSRGRQTKLSSAELQRRRDASELVNRMVRVELALRACQDNLRLLYALLRAHFPENDWSHQDE